MASTRVYRTLAANSEKKGSISVWFKLGAGFGTDRVIIGSYYDGTYHSAIKVNSDNRINIFDYRSGFVSNLTPYTMLRDPAAWYHLVFEWDTTQGAAADRNKIYINGVQETSFETETNYSADYIPSWNRDYTLSIGARNSDQYWDGEMSHLYFIQGYAYAASTFGSTDATSGIWKINTGASVNYTGTGTNSSFLKFEDSSNLDLDSGSNTNTFTTAGTLTATKDNPSNNFCTGNLLDNYYQQSNFSNGNNTVEITQPSGNHGYCSCTLGVGAGLWYFEAKPTTGTDRAVGFVDILQPDSSENMGQGGTGSTFCFRHNGETKQGGSSSAYGSAYSTDDIIGVYLDLTANKAYFSINGTLQNSGTGLSITAADSTTTGYYKPGADSTNGSDTTWQFNFGNGTFGTTLVSSAVADAGGEGQFEYDPSAGTFDGSSKDFRAICTKNIKAYGG